MFEQVNGSQRLCVLRGSPDAVVDRGGAEPLANHPHNGHHPDGAALRGGRVREGQLWSGVVSGGRGDGGGVETVLQVDSDREDVDRGYHQSGPLCETVTGYQKEKGAAVVPHFE
jgi:hypothetical protein